MSETNATLNRLIEVRKANAARESLLRLNFAREVIAPRLAHAFGSKRIWAFGSVATGNAHADSDLDILVEGGEGLTASERLDIAYDIVSSADVPCGCDVVVLTNDEMEAKSGVSFVDSMTANRVLIYHE